jgi:hypothetical protein
MTTITMRYTKGAFLVTGKDIEARTFGASRGAKDWCEVHHPGSPIREIGRDAASHQLGNLRCRAMARLDQRGALPLRAWAYVAVAVIPLIILWEYLFYRTTRRLLGGSTNPNSGRGRQ